MLAFALAGSTLVVPVKIAQYLWRTFAVAIPLHLKMKKDRLERCQRLGINPQRTKSKTTGREEWENFTVFTLTPDDLEPCLRGLAGQYCLSEEEQRLQSVGMRAVMLEHRQGTYGQNMLAHSEITSIPYEDMEFLWKGVNVDFKWLLHVSQQRLSDPDFMKELRQAKSA